MFGRKPRSSISSASSAKNDHLDVLQAQVLLLVEVDQATLGTDDDFDTLLQRINLGS